VHYGSSSLEETKKSVKYQGMEGLLTYLVIGEDQRVCQHHILSPPSSEDDNFSNVVRRQRFTTSINSICFRPITAESDNGEFLIGKSVQLRGMSKATYRFDLSGIDFNDSYPRSYQFSS